MNYSEIRSQYVEMQRVIYETLRHVMKNLPTNCGIKCNSVSFKDSYFPPIVYMEDQCTGNIERVTVTMVTISANGEEMWYNGFYTDLDGNEEIDGEEIIDRFDTQTCKAILDAIDQDVLDNIKPFYPQPQTLLVVGTEEVDEYMKIDDNHNKVKNFIKRGTGGYVTRRAFVTEGERKAYMRGSDDTVGYMEACFISNDNYEYDI